MAADLGAPDTGLFARLWDDARSHLLVVGAGLVVVFLLVKKFGTATKVAPAVSGMSVQSTTAGYQVPGTAGTTGPPGPPGTIHPTTVPPPRVNTQTVTARTTGTRGQGRGDLPGPAVVTGPPDPFTDLGRQLAGFGRGGAAPVHGNQGPAVGAVGAQAGGASLGPATVVPRAGPALLSYPAPLTIHPIGTMGF